MYNGYYSLIQFCPDPSRAEVANVGVLLYCPDMKFIDAAVISKNDKIKRFFGLNDFDPSLLKLAKNSIKNRISFNKDKIDTIKDLEKFIKTRMNDIRLTDLRSIKIEKPDTDLINLFHELVEPAEGTKQKRRKTIDEVDKIFRRPAIANKITFDCTIQLPVQKRNIVIPYAFQNGYRNLIKPIRLSLDTQGMDRVLSVACEGDLLQRHETEGIKNKFIVILVPDKNNGQTLYSSKETDDIFSEYQIRTVYDNKLEDLAEEIELTGH